MPTTPPSLFTGARALGRRAPARRAVVGVTCLWLASLAPACRALIDQELANKGSDGGLGGGGSGGDSGGRVSTTSLSTTTTSTTATTTGGGECGEADDCQLEHAKAVCADGICTIDECFWTFADCNGERLDGCEIDLQNDDDNCGKCGDDCSGNKSCQEGSCD